MIDQDELLCPFCNKTQNIKTIKLVWANVEHPGSFSYECDKCQRPFKIRAYLIPLFVREVKI